MAVCREDYGAERYENVSFQQAVREEFQALHDEHFHVVDANRGIDEIHSDIVGIARQTAQACLSGKKPLTELWDRNVAANKAVHI